MEAQDFLLDLQKNSSAIFDFIRPDSEYVDTLPLMSSPWPTAAIVSAYLYFVLRAGPRMMEKKTAFILRHVLAVYNLSLVIFSSWLVYQFYSSLKGQFFMGHCRPRSLGIEKSKQIDKLAWFYVMSKLIELLDTVFFVLRRKMNQVTFLHVYHHVNMALLSWVFLKTVPGSQTTIISMSNSFVHVLMYGYYFLAAMGPAIQPYLWWKRYLTRIQILQFVLIIGFMVTLMLTPSCEISKQMIGFSIANTISFLVLFLFFYFRTYRNKQKSQ